MEDFGKRLKGAEPHSTMWLLELAAQDTLVAQVAQVVHGGDAAHRHLTTERQKAASQMMRVQLER